jgi:hypothetical protein
MKTFVEQLRRGERLGLERGEEFLLAGVGLVEREAALGGLCF